MQMNLSPLAPTDPVFPTPAMANYFKYPRTYHLPWSQGLSSDDKVLKSVEHFEGQDVVVTEKMDGENTTMYSDKIYARSIDSNGGEDRAWVKQLWSTIRGEIPQGWRICGENLYAQHSLPYGNLKSYFYGFSVWDDLNQCLPWSDTLEIFSILGITPVNTLYCGKWDEGALKQLSASLDTTKVEGYVVRAARSFPYSEFGQNVAKFVRANHVQTDKHWRHSALVPNTLINPTDNTL